jgi:hypothetical protein
VSEKKKPLEGLRVPLPEKPPKVEQPKKGKGSYRRRSKHPKEKEPPS